MRGEKTGEGDCGSRHDLSPEERRALAELESLLGEELPEVQQPDWRHFGFQVHSGHVAALELLGRGLETLPSSVGALAGLKALNLTGNRLSELPDSIGALRLLRELNLQHNRLGALPYSIGGLSSLE